VYHFRKTQRHYKKHLRPAMCPFCDPETKKRQVRENKHSYIVHNITKYDLWEMHGVTEHLLLLPKRHVMSLSELGPEERLEIIDTIAEYESLGYHTYARSLGR
jgi:diadenosine tetraphosphate (Ap4A) HIT family hydrolase